MTRTSRQNGFVLLPVVLAIVVIATIAFLINTESAINVDMTADATTAVEVEQIARAGLAHATWGTQSSGCAGDMVMTTVPFGQGGTDSYTATVTTPGGTISAYTLSADHDTYIRESNPGSASGGDDAVRVDNKSADLMHALYRFDLSAIPAGSQINSAVVWLYVTANDDEGALSVHRVTADWDEATASWDNMNGNFDGAVLGMIPAQPDVNVWVQVNLTAQVQAWVNGGEPNYGILLQSTLDAIESRYATKEWGTSSQRPRLEVITGTGPASPATITANGTLAGNPSPANDISRTLTRTAVPVYQPPGNAILQLGVDAGEDTILDAFYDVRNYGGINYLQVHDNGSDWRQYPVIRFDLAALPRGASVRSARLELSLLNLNAPGTASIHQVTRSWVEGTKSGGGIADGATWFTHDGTNAWTSAGGDINAPVVAETAIDGSETWVSWEIAPLVERWLAGEPNHGLLIKPDSALKLAKFASKEHYNVGVQPKLTITYACECGSPCLAPQGSGTVLMVVVNPTTLVPADAYKKALFESWGYTVKVISESANQATYDTEIASSDVVYISETVNSSQVGSKLAGAPIGVVSEDGDYNGDLGLATGSGYAVGSAIEVTDASHYITALFPLGLLDIYSAAMEGLTVAGSEAPGLQTLADTGGAGSLVVLDTGAMGIDGNPVASPRVMLPLGRDTNFNWDYLNANGRLLVQRALQWGTGNHSGAPILIYRDEFTNRNCDAADYTGSDGELDWSPWAWVETGDDGAPCGGNISLAEDAAVSEPGNYRIHMAGGGLEIEREADLSGFSTAHLSFDYRRDGFGNPPDALIVSVSDDGGSTWHDVDHIEGPATDTTYQSTSYDISAYLNAATLIRFATTIGNADTAWIDNIQISETGAAEPPLSYNVLMIVGNLTLSSKDVGYKALIESWGHTVTLIDDGDSQANYDTAMDAADVILASGSASGSSMLDKATYTTKGLVNEVNGKIDNFGFSSSTSSTTNFDTFSKTDPAHYITEPFLGNPVTVFTASLTNPVPGGTLAPDLQNVGEVTGTLALGTLDSGATRYDSNPSPGRRAHLPFAAAETTNLTADGKTILQRTIEWAAGAGTSNPTAPIAHWKLDETSGTTAIDSEGGHNGTLTFVPGWDTGVIAGGLSFDGVNDYINVPHDANLTFTGGLTFTAWGNTLDTSGGYKAILAKDTPGNGASNYWFGIENDELVFGFWTAGSFRTVKTTDSNLQSGTWYHLAASFDNATDVVRLYVDGTEVQVGAITFEPTVETADLWIGHSPDGEYWNGKLDDVRIYNTVLGGSEISDLASAGGGGGGGGGGEPPACAATFGDDFETDDYAGSTGTAPWAGNWSEINDSGNPSNGDVQVAANSGNLTLSIGNSAKGAQRVADLSAHATATLTLGYWRSGLDSASEFGSVEISTDGSNWTVLDQFVGPGNDTTSTPPTVVSYDISGHISPTTHIRFLTAPDNGKFDRVLYDDIEICAN